MRGAEGEAMEGAEEEAMGGAEAEAMGGAEAILSFKTPKHHQAPPQVCCSFHPNPAMETLIMLHFNYYAMLGRLLMTT